MSSEATNARYEAIYYNDDGAVIDRRTLPALVGAAGVFEAPREATFGLPPDNAARMVIQFVVGAA